MAKLIENITSDLKRFGIMGEIFDFMNKRVELQNVKGMDDMKNQCQWYNQVDDYLTARNTRNLTQRERYIRAAGCLLAAVESMDRRSDDN